MTTAQAVRMRVSVTKAELVYRAIRGDIMAGRLAAGTPLDEVVLAGVHEVSRTPVREALGRLTTDGLAVAGPRRQVLVVELSDSVVRRSPPSGPRWRAPPHHGRANW